MTRIRSLRLAAVVALSGVSVNAAAAQSPAAQSPVATRNHLYDRIQLTVSGTNVWLGPRIRIDATDSTPGTEVSGDDLGLTGSTLEPRVGLRWRLGRRHELDMGYQMAAHSGERVLTDTIQVGDSTFATGLRVQTDNRADQAYFTYRFAFHARDRSQIGAALGLGAILFDLDIQAVSGATTGGPDTTIVPFGIKRSVTAPTASLGLYGRWQLGDKWYLETDARVLYLEVDRIAATVIEGGAAARYFMSSRFGFELGYGLTGVKVELAPGTGSGAGNELAGVLRYALQNLRFGVIAVP